MADRRLRAGTLSLVCSAAILFLPGCAEVMLVSSVAILAKGPTSDESREVELNRQTFAYPVADVYEVMTQEVERNGRKIVDRDPEAHSLRVSYPFSWLQNNWGGIIKVSCTPDESDPTQARTTVTIVGGARDAIGRLRKIGDEVIADLNRALRQRARSL